MALNIVCRTLLKDVILALDLTLVPNHCHTITGVS